MKHYIIAVSLLIGLALSAPTSEDKSDKVVITDKEFPDELVVYTGKHDIVDILVPLNALNFDEDSDEESSDDDSGTLYFFVEADIDAEGKRVDKGLYVFKKNVTTKLLDNGRAAAATNDDSKTAYFAASDGIYSYDVKKNTAEKYGSVADSLIDIAKINNSDVIYVLTENHEVYKVTEGGTRKVKLDNVVNAQQIVLDFSDNLYFYGPDKKPKVITSDGIKEITGLPENPTSIRLIKPPFIIENGVPFIVDNKAYLIYANGTSELTDFEFKVIPTAFSMEGTLIQYYGYNKKIYEYNILLLVLEGLVDELKDFLEDKKDDIRSIATRSRSDFKA